MKRPTKSFMWSNAPLLSGKQKWRQPSGSNTQLLTPGSNCTTTKIEKLPQEQPNSIASSRGGPSPARARPHRTQIAAISIINASTINAASERTQKDLKNHPEVHSCFPSSSNFIDGDGVIDAKRSRTDGGPDTATRSRSDIPDQRSTSCLNCKAWGLATLDPKPQTRGPKPTENHVIDATWAKMATECCWMVILF